MTTLHDLATPCLVLDVERMERNVARLRGRLDALGVRSGRISRPRKASTSRTA
jgi:D-serine deaminase-like pyridoxal phosphate-dependent protein